ncbi:Hypothetical_protein [Hexamita inflata]|uniref:Hypothetical_protein n=1 Tax=Hexamita inflata TaxID=28002 RepID=A0AA86NQP9_9EUKA|nr:Hypothetical protein HINF_LOCUS10790 [Hexamita inflata]
MSDNDLDIPQEDNSEGIQNIQQSNMFQDPIQTKQPLKLKDVNETKQQSKPKSNQSESKKSKIISSTVNHSSRDDVHYDIKLFELSEKEKKKMQKDKEKRTKDLALKKQKIEESKMTKDEIKQYRANLKKNEAKQKTSDTSNPKIKSPAAAKNGENSTPMSDATTFIPQQAPKAPQPKTLTAAMSKQTVLLLKSAKIDIPSVEFITEYEKRISQPEFQYVERFPVNSRGFRFTLTLCTILALLLQSVSYFLRILNTTPTFNFLVFVLFVIITDLSILSVQFRFAPLFKLFVDEIKLLVHKGPINIFVIVFSQMNGYQKNVATYLQIASEVLSGIVVVVWAVQWTTLMSCGIK